MVVCVHTMSQSGDGHHSTNSGESLRERRLHDENNANHEETSYEQSLRQAKMESIAEDTARRFPREIEDSRRRTIA